MYYLVCLNVDDCGWVELYEEEPTHNQCDACHQPAVWYTVEYYLNKIKPVFVGQDFLDTDLDLDD